MVVDFAIDMERAGNTTPAEAAVKGGLIRFRPTMMMTMAAIMGTLPIVLGTGAGASARQPLGLSSSAGWYSRRSLHSISPRSFTLTWIPFRPG